MKVRISLLLAALTLVGCASTSQKKLVVNPSVNHPSLSQLVVLPIAQNNLDFLYANVRTIEFGFCAYGRRSGETVTVKRITLPFIKQAGPNGVEAELCTGRGLLGNGYSRAPMNECGFSKTDAQGFDKNKYLFVMCSGSFHLLTRTGLMLSVSTLPERSGSPPR